MTTVLQITRTTSRGRDTYGWNICRLDDTTTGKRYRCHGGGYDMTGTVFGVWLQDTHGAELAAIGGRAFYGPNFERSTDPDALYGMRQREDGYVVLDGACGLSSMETVARALGLHVHHVANRRGQLTHLVVEKAGEQ